MVRTDNLSAETERMAGKGGKEKKEVTKMEDGLC